MSNQPSLWADSPISEHEILLKRIEELEIQVSNLRKGLFARYDNVHNQIGCLTERFSDLEVSLGIKTYPRPKLIEHTFFSE